MPTLDHRGATSPAQVQPAFARQRPVSFGHRVVMDAEVEPKLSHCGQLTAGLQPASHQLRPQPVRHLLVSRNRRAQVDAQDSGFEDHCLMYTYNVQPSQTGCQPLFGLCLQVSGIAAAVRQDSGHLSRSSSQDLRDKAGETPAMVLPGA